VAAVLWEPGRQASMIAVKLGSTAVQGRDSQHPSCTAVSEAARRRAQVVIGMDNQAAIKAVHSMESRPGHYLVDEVHRAAERQRVLWPGFSLVIRWVPGHNITACQETKRRTC
jgi:hypothetical protein